MAATSDISGWDRSSYLRDVYYLRNKHLKCPPHFRDMQSWVTFFSIHGVSLLPNGQIIFKAVGNSSGKNNTCVDNGILHQIIVFDLIINMWLYKHHSLPTLQELLDVCDCALYSDDKVLVWCEETFGISVEEYVDLEKIIYAKYGMEIKAKQSRCWTFSGKLDNRMEFLGSEAYYDSELGMYLPYPRFGKICSSLKRSLHALSPQEQYCKLVALASISYPRKDVFDFCILFLDWMWETYPEHQVFFDSHIRELQLDFKTPETFLRIQTGHE